MLYEGENSDLEENYIAVIVNFGIFRLSTGRLFILCEQHVYLKSKTKCKDILLNSISNENTNTSTLLCCLVLPMFYMSASGIANCPLLFHLLSIIRSLSLHEISSDSSFVAFTLCFLIFGTVCEILKLFLLQ